MRALAILILAASTGGCYNRHVNGTTSQACPAGWTAIVNNTTDRTYMLVVRDKYVARVEPKAYSKTRLDPQLGSMFPTLTETGATRERQGPRLAKNAVQMVCE